MENNFIEFLSQYITLTEDEKKIIEELNLIRKYKKGTVLLKEGMISNECYWVLKGCLRSYYVIDGEEKTTAFFTETQIATPVSYAKRTPSEYYISCLEDCMLSVGTIEKTNMLISKIPKVKIIGNILNGELLVENQILFDNYMMLTAEKRYLKLLETRPDLCNRVPQYHLASYLGIKPESLSRIRRRLIKKNA